ncbi:MAG: response regulator, partial [Oleispira antarctica]|nr:response regulator [Oleispira antarctica]MBQ0791682.1 response regulator [Oleispira antarctica]
SLQQGAVQSSEHEVMPIAAKHLLVAEDNEINRLVIEAILENEGITADIVNNGQLAVDKIQERAYDAVLMDCQMPVMDGYTATAAIRSIPGYENIPIFALTADATTESKVRAKKVGFTGHLSKPIRVEDLMNALNHM